MGWPWPNGILSQEAHAVECKALRREEMQTRKPYPGSRIGSEPSAELVRPMFQIPNSCPGKPVPEDIIIKYSFRHI